MTSLPHSLVRFEVELGNAIRRESQAGARRRRRVLRAVAVPVAAAAVAVGVLSVLPNKAPSVVDRAVAAMSGTGNAIVHVSMVGEKVGAGGRTSSWQEESWQETKAPFAHRWIRTSNGRRAEVLVPGDGTTELYDEATNTIYRVTGLPPGEPLSNPPDGFAGKQALVKSLGSIQSKALWILESGRLAESGHTRVDGQDALRLANEDESTTILLNPRTYVPIRWTTTADGTKTTVRFDAYESLDRMPATERLLDLEAQHKGAKVDDSLADYQAAAARLGLRQS